MMKTCRGIAWGLVCPKLADCAHHDPAGAVPFFCNPQTLAAFEPRNPFPTEVELFKLEIQPRSPAVDTTLPLF
jgi:hypothetical protein